MSIDPRGPCYETEIAALSDTPFASTKRVAMAEIRPADQRQVKKKNAG